SARAAPDGGDRRAAGDRAAITRSDRSDDRRALRGRGPGENLYIVAYDISDPRRWRRVFRLMNGYGEWLQLSVFQCRLSQPATHRVEVRGWGNHRPPTGPCGDPRPRPGCI